MPTLPNPSKWHGDSLILLGQSYFFLNDFKARLGKGDFSFEKSIKYIKEFALNYSKSDNLYYRGSYSEEKIQKALEEIKKTENEYKKPVG